MSNPSEKMEVEFKSDCGRILRTEALNIIDMITITVGTGAEAVKFPVHEAVARKSSAFLDNAMKPEWASPKADPRDIQLVDEDPELFKVYLHWLYFKNMPTVYAGSKGKNYNHEYVLLCRCYIMGEKLMDVGFKNAMLDALVGAMENTPRLVPGLTAINIIYAGTLGGSPARRFLVDIWVKMADESWLDYLTAALPHAFVLEFSRVLLQSRCKGKEDTRAWMERVKEYHEA
ncbi:uncharacterized protein K460DRAFT_357369 [Cucurbitaria berberidis CBS 394.84]|uniref:BTB domain-containing protein n=1 Tax=Cucurbitaria berberidis CBS 394.84 TaxID=1168544 RepID=A0A9P4GED1_9PLEO|nr:uncharacterized protein K460DRAFT_357369 [Cucurbitaria berberidis CBS 394.84]KAF1843670.1 hypothetical protein K460DRAFT_357369 [Cucurbitaria berberidis CBS 394.84]